MCNVSWLEFDSLCIDASLQVVLLDDRIVSVKEAAACCLAHLATGPHTGIKDSIVAAGALPHLKTLLSISQAGCLPVHPQPLDRYQ